MIGRVAKSKVLAPIRPSAAIEIEYRRRLIRMIDKMAKSVEYWIGAAFRKALPESTMATDELPANYLRRAIAALAKRWLSDFDEMARELARYFASSNAKRSDIALKRILTKGGFAVEFKMTMAQRDAIAAIVHENVALIKSIPQRYFSEVEGMVMRSVSLGGDLEQLNEDLVKTTGVTKRRALLIARDQNNKANSALQHVRYGELGIEQAIWLHSRGGKEPRPTHVANSGRPYDVKTGWYDPHERKFIIPGQLINCRCQSRPVIRGLA